MTIRFEHLTHPTPGDLARVRAIYESNFPPVMQKPFRLIDEGVADGTIMLLAACDAGIPLGFATIARLPAAQAMYLSYFAVDSAAQNQGIGSRLFQFMAETLERATQANVLVWEVEAPERDPAAIENRRIRFYERLGARIAGMAATYRMPDLEPGQTIPLRLMWLLLAGRTARPHRDEVAAWIQDIYDMVYPGEDDLAAAIIAELDPTHEEPDV